MAEEAKFCEKCGAPLSTGARFCPRCGREIPAAAIKDAPIILQVVDDDDEVPQLRVIEPEELPPPPPQRGIVVHMAPVAEETRLPPPPPPPQRQPLPEAAPVLRFSPLAVLKALLLTMFNPRGVLTNLLGEVTIPVAVAISGLAFLLFFLQTGLDMLHAGTGAVGRMIGLTLMGLAYGIIGVPAIALIAWLAGKPFGNPKSIPWAVGAFCLSFSPALVYLLIGLIFNLLFGWNTSLAFGVTGALWALPCLITAVQEMLPNRLILSVVVATLCGAILLYGWTWLGAAV